MIQWPVIFLDFVFDTTSHLLLYNTTTYNFFSMIQQHGIFSNSDTTACHTLLIIYYNILPFYFLYNTVTCHIFNTDTISCRTLLYDTTACHILYYMIQWHAKFN